MWDVHVQMTISKGEEWLAIGAVRMAFVHSKSVVVIAVWCHVGVGVRFGGYGGCGVVFGIV